MRLFNDDEVVGVEELIVKRDDTAIGESVGDEGESTDGDLSIRVIVFVGVDCLAELRLDFFRLF